VHRVSWFIIICVSIYLLIFLLVNRRWGQITILTAIADYKVSGGKEAESICDRVMPRLQHANGAVVLSAIKVLMINMRYIKEDAFVKTMCRKMAPPLGNVELLDSVCLLC
jgi:vesicle coat complex subunit